MRDWFSNHVWLPDSHSECQRRAAAEASDGDDSSVLCRHHTAQVTSLTTAPPTHHKRPHSWHPYRHPLLGPLLRLSLPSRLSSLAWCINPHLTLSFSRTPFIIFSVQLCHHDVHSRRLCRPPRCHFCDGPLQHVLPRSPERRQQCFRFA